MAVLVVTARVSHVPEAWRLIGPEMLSCPSCKAYECATAYGAHGAMVRVCRQCSARAWSCPACGNGPAVERDEQRVCPCGWTGHVPTAERPALRLLPYAAPVERQPANVESIQASAQAVDAVSPVAPMPAPEPKKRAPTTRKPREQKPPPGQNSLF
jgi:hypothetical protein